MKLLILNAEEVTASMDVKDVIEADKEAMALYSKGESNIPLRAIWT